MPGAVIHDYPMKLLTDDLFARAARLVLAELRKSGVRASDVSETVWQYGPTHDPEDERFRAELNFPSTEEGSGDAIVVAEARLDWYTGLGEARVWPERIPPSA